MVHEIGLKFDELIDAREYVPLTTRNGRFAVETLEEADISGRLIAVDPNPPDLEVLNHLLSGTKASLAIAESGEQALRYFDRECDLLLCADELPGMQPAELIEKYRRSQNGAPVILMTPAESRPLVQPPPGVSAMLSKPIAREDLFRCVGEFLILSEDARSRAGVGPRHEAILETFCRDIRELAPRIERAFAENDAMGCFVLSQQVLGAAPQVGLKTLTRLADAASETLAITMSLEQSKSEVEALIEACRHVAAKAK
jgi:CheY-like chemotaxis protein